MRGYTLVLHSGNIQLNKRLEGDLMHFFLKLLMPVFVAFMSFSNVMAADNELKQAKESITARFAGLPADNISSSPINGLYVVSMPPRLFYISADAKYVIDGDMIDIALNENVTQPLRSKVRMDAIDGLGVDSMIVFAPEKAKHIITVFTDIDCGYCRKLHNSIADYNKLGIEIRYLAYPRAGLESESYNKAVSVWCAKDRKDAMTRAKNDQSVESKVCDSPVASHFKLGNLMGVQGTPALVMENGQIIPGYVPPDRLLAILDNGKK
ncbi:MAG: bifunctional protein-disulfide isomerase/oxidoreductase DsbC [Gammaproteobacteria bacterium]|nr:bifunctional protein-disulfide isomerase/oxidoreductase DsbC [Gammaproteobacteria bacterium]